MAVRTATHLGLRLAALLAVFAAVAGCSSGDGSAGTKAHRKPAPSIATYDPSQPRSVRLADIQQARIALRGGGGPDWMVVGFGSLWVRRDNAVITRLDNHGRVLATIDAGIWQVPVCQGLGVSPVAIWGCATEGKLERIDPRTNKVAAIVPIPKVNEQGRLIAWGGRIWVLTGDGDELTPIDEKTNTLGSPIDLGAYCVSLSDTVVGSVIWAACPYDGLALRIDLRAGQVTDRVAGLDGPTEVTADGRRVWVCARDGVAKVAPDGSRIEGVQRVPIGVGCDVRLIGDTLWLRGQAQTSPFLTAIDADSGRITQVVSSPVVKLNAGDMISYAGSLWVAAFEGETLFRTRPPGF